MLVITRGYIFSRAQDKLQAYLQLAAAGHSPIDYVRETSGLPIEDRSFLLEPESESEVYTQEETIDLRQPPQSEWEMEMYFFSCVQKGA